MDTTVPTTQQHTTDAVSADYREVIPIQEEIGESPYIRNLFDDEGAFGESDCPGL